MLTHFFEIYCLSTVSSIFFGAGLRKNMAKIEGKTKYADSLMIVFLLKAKNHMDTEILHTVLRQTQVVFVVYSYYIMLYFTLRYLGNVCSVILSMNLDGAELNYCFLLNIISLCWVKRG